jgi:diguanylate cyclase (GGDEF)-like protein
MVPPRPPPGEAARLAALHQLGILDTPPEERFDCVTRLARRMFGAPIALVSLVDADRQWFKSRAGLEVPETSRAISFCGHAVQDDAALVVPDARSDLRFADNPLVVGFPNIAFYAGCPVRAPDGSALGTLCVIDHQPRDFSRADLDALADLAEVVSAQLGEAALAVTDELTGLMNRRGLAQVGAYLLKVARHRDAPVSVLYLDLDGFKAINDRSGHAAGDDVLRAVAMALRTSAREGDVPARLGGDEFAVLMSDTRAEELPALVERLRGALEPAGYLHAYPTKRTPLRSSATPALTTLTPMSAPARSPLPVLQRGVDFTFGSATASDGAGYDLDELLASADREMYERRTSVRKRA